MSTDKPGYTHVTGWTAPPLTDTPRREPKAPDSDPSAAHRYEEIPPCKPLDLGYASSEEAQRWAFHDREKEEFLEKELADTITWAHTFNKETRKWEEKPRVFKRGYKVIIYPPNKDHCGIVTTDPTRAAFKGLDLVTGAKQESDDRREWAGLTCTEARNMLMTYKDRLYQDVDRISKEIGHIPCVPLKTYYELIKKYGNTTPVPDMTKYDMEIPDKLMENRTLSDARDMCEASCHERSGSDWPAVYVFGPATDYGLRWNQAYIVDTNIDKTGMRESPAMSLEEGKKIAEGRGIAVIRMRNEDAKYYHSIYYFERDHYHINIQKDSVVSYRRNGKWIDIEPSPLRRK